MLVNKQSSYNNGDIVSFKLANGDEVIAEIVEVTDAGWIVKRPYIVVPSQQGIGLMQALFTGNLERGLELNRSNVLLHSDTIPEMHSHYIKTTTGIDVAPKSRIIS